MKVIIGEKYKEKLQIPLENLGVDCIFLPKNKDIEWQVNSHADMQIIQISHDIFVCEPSICVDFPVIYGKSILKSGYPNNICYNGLKIGNHFFHNLKYTDKMILDNLKNVNLHNVKQGYSKCSVLIIDDNTAITSDLGMFNALTRAKINTLLIECGHIDLDGYNYGFIGGCGFRLNNQTFCFTGKLNHHPSFNDICSFLSSYNIQIHYLTNDKIFDIGSILPILN